MMESFSGGFYFMRIYPVKLPEVRHVLNAKRPLLWIFLNLYQLYLQPTNKSKQIHDIITKPTLFPALIRCNFGLR